MKISSLLFAVALVVILVGLLLKFFSYVQNKVYVILIGISDGMYSVYSTSSIYGVLACVIPTEVIANITIGVSTLHIKRNIQQHSRKDAYCLKATQTILLKDYPVIESESIDKRTAQQHNTKNKSPQYQT